jgi:flagellar basal-body rod protein FlgB
MTNLSSVEVMQAALSIREAQLSLTASNLANIDTPKYKAKGLDFKTELNNIINDTGIKLNKTRPNHLSGSYSPHGFDVLYVNSGSVRVDGNSVNGTLEKTKFAEYQLQYQAALELSAKSTKSLVGAYKDAK